DKVMLILMYLKDNYYYSLKPGIAENGKQLHHFLFTSRKGYCSYFAFSMALLCRSLGIPARVAVGFYVDPDSEILNFYPVRADMAHAWVEVYFNEYGWIEFDPTSEITAPGEEYRFGETPVAKVTALIEEILNNEKDLKSESAATGKQSVTPFTVGRQIALWVTGMLKLWYVTLPALYIVLIAILRFYPYPPFYGARNTRRKAVFLFRILLQAAYRFNWVQKADESILEYALRIENKYGVRLRRVSELYLKAIYAGTFTDSDYSSMVTYRKEFISELRRRIPIYLRFIAFFNPIGSLRKKG
ncbi:MAG: transglutaminase-like domain-containing protein, partial [Spirochaetota bacterium]